MTFIPHFSFVSSLSFSTRRLVFTNCRGGSLSVVSGSLYLLHGLSHGVRSFLRCLWRYVRISPSVILFEGKAKRIGSVKLR
jgi:hypothetical protein